MANRTKVMDPKTTPATAQMNGAANLPPIKQMIRGIAVQPMVSPDGELFTAQQVDKELAAYIAQGYRLKSATPAMVRSQAGGGSAPTILHWRVFYVLELA